ncbi:DUF1330 domain-containing protein [Microbulbifer sp. SAOS-129_SWC]|uniref:DUF1330 domain-containing protein n=1 Tax=Microbulbifer sp. SAOS-129_SWC TaxID=3145235 RepID=UPI0032163487
MWKPVCAMLSAVALSGCVYVNVADSDALYHSDECDLPAYLVYTGVPRDPAALTEYQQALAHSVREQDYHGRLLNDTNSWGIIADNEASDQTVLITRFPCLQKVQSFLHGKENRKLENLRERAGNFTFAVYPAASAGR